jgi:hypothetical protein
LSLGLNLPDVTDSGGICEGDMGKNVFLRGYAHFTEIRLPCLPPEYFQVMMEWVFHLRMDESLARL